MFIVHSLDSGVVGIYDDLDEARDVLRKLPMGYEIMMIEKIEMEASMFLLDPHGGKIVDRNADMNWWKDRLANADECPEPHGPDQSL